MRLRSPGRKQARWAGPAGAQRQTTGPAIPSHQLQAENRSTVPLLAHMTIGTPRRRNDRAKGRGGRVMARTMTTIIRRTGYAEDRSVSLVATWRGADERSKRGWPRPAHLRRHDGFNSADVVESRFASGPRLRRLPRRGSRPRGSSELHCCRKREEPTGALVLEMAAKRQKAETPRWDRRDGHRLRGFARHVEQTPRL